MTKVDAAELGGERFPAHNPLNTWAETHVDRALDARMLEALGVDYTDVRQSPL